MSRFMAYVLLFMCTLLFGMLIGVHHAGSGILGIGSNPHTGAEAQSADAAGHIVNEEVAAESEDGQATAEVIAGQESEQIRQEENRPYPPVESSPAETGSTDSTEDGAHTVEAEAVYEDVETYITRIDGDEVEVAVVGQAIDLDSPASSTSVAQHSNRYSRAGNALGDMIYSVSKRGGEWFVRQLDKLL